MVHFWAQMYARQVSASKKKEPMRSKTRAISIWQPFAELILQGKKKKEFRSRRTAIRGKVYIYACRKIDHDTQSWRKVGTMEPILPIGKIVGTAEIIDCKPTSGGGFAFILANPKRYSRCLKPKNQPQPCFWIPHF